MSTYDSYDPDPPRRKSHRHHHHDRDRRDRDDYADEPRFVETKETYVRSAPVAPDPPYVSSRTSEVMRRPVREDSDISIEEVRRDFPPPQGAAYVQSRTLVTRDKGYSGQVDRARSADDREYDYNQQAYGAYRDDPRRSDDRNRRGRSALIVSETVKEPRRRSLSRNQKIASGVAGAALAVAAKELFDRRGDLKHAPEKRNLLGTAAVGAAGAFAGYEGAEFAHKRFGKEEIKEKNYVAVKGRDGEVAEYYNSDEEPKRPKPSRRKSLVDSALAFAGVGAAKAAVDGRDRRKDGRHRDDSDSDDRKSTRSRRSRRNSDDNGLGKIQQAAKAALLAGAAEAFRVRNEPGGWAGAKGKRILTAAIGATAIDAVADRDPDKHGKRHILESVIGGLASNRLVNGSRKDIEEDYDGKSVHDRSKSRARSRSRAPSQGGGGGAGGPLAALAAAGLAGLAGKKILDRDRSRSRSRGDDRRRHHSSDDDDRRRGSGKRSKSVTDYARKGLAALGIGEAADASRDRSRSRDGRREVIRDETYVSSSRGGGSGRRRRNDSEDDDYDDRRRSRGDVNGPVAAGALGAYEGSRGGRYDDDYDTRSQRNGRGGGKSQRQKNGERHRRVAEGKESDSSSDLGSSTDDEKRAKKMKGKQLLTAGLATVATIHAAHNVYQSMQKRDARHKAVQEGEMTPEEAHKLKMKARLQDAASIGIAALGVKGAYSEWKEMKEIGDECKEFESKKEERHQKRIERLKGMQNGQGPTRPPNKRLQSNSTPNLYQSGRYQTGPPRYIDDNPYNAVPAQTPPGGYSYGDRR